MIPRAARSCGASAPAPGSTLRRRATWSATSNTSWSAPAATFRSTPSAATTSSRSRSIENKRTTLTERRDRLRSRFFWKLVKAKSCESQVMSSRLCFAGLGSVVAAMAFAIMPLRATGIDEQVQACAGCHGENGKPVDKTIPNIWGQQTGYLYIQLRDFKRGDRKSEIMQPIASGFERDDMLAIAEYFSKKQW